MEEKQQVIQKVKLVQKLGTFNYKLVIPAEVERKIRFACQRVWDTEWSGTLFFTYEGSFENNDLVIKCVDIYIMDIGTQTYTEFDMNPDVIAYMTEHTELLDCQLGLIHSHGCLQTFFSGTDQQTLKEEGTDRNNFVSLIVNNAGNYTAAITRKVKSKQVKEFASYEFFGEGVKQYTKEYSNDIDKIEWFYLNIEKEEDTFSFQDMDDRFEEIKKRKAEMDKKYPNQLVSYGTNVKPTFTPNESISTQSSLFNDLNNLPLSYIDSDTPYDVMRFDKDTIKRLTLQVVTGSIIIPNDSKIDIRKWATSMPTMYQKRFGKGEEGIRLFKLWADTYTEFLVWYATDSKLEAQGMDDTEICAICAYDIIEELTKLPENEYIKGYIDALQKYLVL